ncbi:hypothetical protein [Chitinophaga sp. Cy-1792]|uniref:hypothetical protein n=1 Tax=Chitinophaga sp. Cy-1792 TaxID=2608339 RepID=UPI00142038CB|nr:hypothetical protein [Chitinophaga sp. Cy-1792]NIG53327.1 hypothetical protein [Chitinophaga sp. Cy-1792]
MWENEQNKRKRRRVARGIFILIFCTIILELFWSLLQDSANNPMHISAVLSSDYHLISDKYADKLSNGVSYQSHNRNPVFVFHFDGKYRLVSYRIDLNSDSSLSKVLEVSNRSVYSSSFVIYNTFPNALFFTYKYRSVQGKPVAHIYMTLAGDSLQHIVKNDSIISDYLICKNMSIRYEAEEPFDIFVVGPDRLFGVTAKFPMDLLLLKKDSTLQLMILTPDDPETGIAPDLLYNIVTGK